MKHIDLFSGIGGFALATEMVWDNVEHIFCDNEPFAQQILQKHWPSAPLYGDIRTLTTDAERQRQLQSQGSEQESGEWSCDLLTGGFPCQPFSVAGRRKGTQDDRFLWPEMLRVIREFRPRWVVGENVAGLLSIEHGLVFEQVCTDLEREGYEVQPFIIPACAVDAPHRRDRVWIIGHAKHNGFDAAKNRQSNFEGNDCYKEGEKQILKSSRPNLSRSNDADTERSRYEGNEYKEGQSTRHSGRPQWDTHWFEVATRLCRVDDGVPRRLDRNPRLKALGNAIVPQVVAEIFKAIKYAEEKV